VLRIAPPFVTLLVVEILFVMAVFRVRKARAASSRASIL
jgi:hypothetical protein